MRAGAALPVPGEAGLTGRGRGGSAGILRLALPALGALAADPLLSLVDTVFVGRLGAVELAALGIDTAIFAFAFALFNFLAYATTPLVAAARGRGDLEGAGAVVRQALTLAVVIGTVAAAGLVVLAVPLVHLFGPAPEVVDPAVEYLRLRALAVPALLVITAGHGAFRGFQDTATPMFVTIGVNAVNAALDPVLMFGVGLGLAGAAGATVVAQWGGAVVFGALLRRRAAAEGWRLGRESLAATRPLLQVGSVLMLRTLLLVASLAVATATASRVGTVEVAAHQVVSQVWFLGSMIVDSLAIAAQAMVADAWARGDAGVARDLSRRLHGWGLATGVALGAALWAGANTLGVVFSTDPAVRVAIGAAAPIAAVMQPLAALVFVADGVYMARVRLAALAASTGVGFAAMVAVSLATLALGWGLEGVWWGMTAMVAGRALVLAWGYRGVFDEARA